ncbi:MAG: hypothetical protein J3K34DRAFT_523987 [Monoraphidium minutum]|nr:MAG: hypothetical protein J3K34DRAFT_523987 [Monoraphidium minutum]
MDARPGVTPAGKKKIAMPKPPGLELALPKGVYASEDNRPVSMVASKVERHTQRGEGRLPNDAVFIEIKGPEAMERDKLVKELRLWEYRDRLGRRAAEEGRRLRASASQEPPAHGLESVRARQKAGREYGMRVGRMNTLRLSTKSPLKAGQGDGAAAAAGADAGAAGGGGGGGDQGDGRPAEGGGEGPAEAALGQLPEAEEQRHEPEACRGSCECPAGIWQQAAPAAPSEAAPQGEAGPEEGAAAQGGGQQQQGGGAFRQRDCWQGRQEVEAWAGSQQGPWCGGNPVPSPVRAASATARQAGGGGARRRRGGGAGAGRGAGGGAAAAGGGVAGLPGWSELAKIAERVAAERIQLAPLCACGHLTSPLDPSYAAACCANCPLRRDATRWAALLRCALHAKGLL